MLAMNTKLPAKQDILHGFFCTNPECEADATEIVAGETAVVVDSYLRAFEVQMDDNENRWWFDNEQAEMWEGIQ